MGKVEGYDLEHEYAVIRQEVEQSAALSQNHSKSEWVAVFKGVNFKRCIAACLPFTFQNFVGTPLVFGYTTYFLQ